MGLAGACPGTALVQYGTYFSKLFSPPPCASIVQYCLNFNRTDNRCNIASGLSHGPYVFLGCIIGGILWSGYGRELHVKECETRAEIGREKTTFYEKLGISESYGLVLFEVVVLSAILATSRFAHICEYP